MVAGAPEIEAMRDPEPTRPLPEDRATVLFAELDVAQARGDYRRAAEAQRQLALLGWVVTRRRPRPDRREAGI
jgi:hypothetical protein